MTYEPPDPRQNFDRWGQSPPAPIPYTYVQPVIAMPQRPSSGTAVWALVLGIVGVVFGWCLLGLPCLAAVVLGHVALTETKSGEKAGRGQAIAGLALGYVALAPAVILFFWAIVGGAGGDPSPSTSP